MQQRNVSYVRNITLVSRGKWQTYVKYKFIYTIVIVYVYTHIYLCTLQTCINVFLFYYYLQHACASNINELLNQNFPTFYSSQTLIGTFYFAS